MQKEEILRLGQQLLTDVELTVLSTANTIANAIYERYYMRGLENESTHRPSTFHPNSSWIDQIAALNSEPKEYLYQAIPNEENFFRQGYFKANFDRSNFRPWLDTYYLTIPEKINPSQQPAFVFVKGVMPEKLQFATQTRIYLHIKDVLILGGIKKCIDMFNDYEIPFHWKFLSDPSWFEFRTDNSVLYILDRHFPLVRTILRENISPEYLLQQKPLFTKEISSGISWAQSPADGDSFGMNRSKLLSKWLVAAQKTDLCEWIKLQGYTSLNLHLDPQPYNSFL